MRSHVTVTCQEISDRCMETLEPLVEAMSTMSSTVLSYSQDEFSSTMVMFLAL